MAIFDKTDFLDLKYPPEVQVEPKTCIAIFRTPVPAILNHKNSTGSAGGAKNSQNGVFLEVPKYVGTVGRNEFFYKIRWSEKSILAR